MEAKLDRIDNKISYTGIDSMSKDVYNKPQTEINSAEWILVC